jgi:hypothetical protein
MNVAGMPLLSTQPETGRWHRTADTSYLLSAIATKHTLVTSSRFYDPFTAAPQFPTLYLSDDRLVALFEAQALFGSPTTPGGTLSAPLGAWVTLAVSVQLNDVVDLTDLGSQMHLDLNVQELTGDWRGFRQRSPRTKVPVPTNVAAPTQQLGHAIHDDRRQLEGFLTLSAKVPHNRNLVVFPDHLQARSFVEYQWSDTGGVQRKYRIDRSNPNGQLVP